jgi:hypothetical protein
MQLPDGRVVVVGRPPPVLDPEELPAAGEAADAAEASPPEPEGEVASAQGEGEGGKPGAAVGGARVYQLQASCAVQP